MNNTTTEAASYVLRGVGRLFYIVSPQSTLYANYKDVPDYVAESIPFFVLTIVLEFLTIVFQDGGKGLVKERKWGASKISVNDIVGSVGAGMLQQLLGKFFLYNITVNSYLYVYNNYRLVDLDYRNIYVWFIGFFIVDLGYYLFHRAAHEINLFWAAHVVHHSSEYYNQTTALRQSILQVYTSWIFDLPAALFLPPSLYVVHKQFNTLFQYWIHTEVVSQLGFLEYIINTPSAHRVHHGRNPYCIDKNYAGTLIIWDIFFGTFALEKTPPAETKDIEPVAFGLTHPIDTFDPFTIQFHHLKHVLRTAWTIPGFANKFKTLFYGPGWHDNTPRTGLLEEIPIIPKDKPPQKYDPTVSLGINIYVVLHFIVIIAVNGLVLDSKPGQISTLHAFVIVANIFAALTSFGRIFDLKEKAIENEFFRGLIVCAVTEFAKQNGSLPSEILYFQIFQLASSAWLFATQRNLKNKTE